MNVKVMMVRGLLVGALATSIFVPKVMARNVKATLYTSQKKEATYPLERDSDDLFLLTGGVLSTSKYGVDFCYGGSASTWTEIDKYNLKTKRTMHLKPGGYKSIVVTHAMCKYDFCKVCMYGNDDQTPKKSCYANTILSHYAEK